MKFTMSSVANCAIVFGVGVIIFLFTFFTSPHIPVTSSFSGNPDVTERSFSYVDNDGSGATINVSMQGCDVLFIDDSSRKNIAVSSYRAAEIDRLADRLDSYEMGSSEWLAARDCLESAMDTLRLGVHDTERDFDYFSSDNTFRLQLNYYTHIRGDNAA